MRAAPKTEPPRIASDDASEEEGAEAAATAAAAVADAIFAPLDDGLSWRRWGAVAELFTAVN